MTDQDKEIAAMNALVAALSELDDEQRTRVLDYVAKRFRLPGAAVASPASLSSIPASESEPRVAGLRAHDIKALKEEKVPSSRIQMAVLVAYYLKSLAPQDERKEAISTTDLETYFNQAKYPLPTGKNGPADTLNNARQAGYLESAGRGLFRLNSVGFNLAAYNMPTGARKTSAKSIKAKPKRRTR